MYAGNISRGYNSSGYSDNSDDSDNSTALSDSAYDDADWDAYESDESGADTTVHTVGRVLSISLGYDNSTTSTGKVQHIDMSVDDVLVLRASINGSTGASQKVEKEEQDAERHPYAVSPEEVLQQVYERTRMTHDRPVPGAPVTRDRYFVANTPGVVLLTISYGRAWEDPKDLTVWKYHIVVHK